MNLRKLKARRVELGLSAEEVAQRLGIKEDAYYRRERGESKFKADEIPIIAEVLQLTPQQMLDFIF